jgi:hypothetical protein
MFIMPVLYLVGCIHNYIFLIGLLLNLLHAACFSINYVFKCHGKASDHKCSELKFDAFPCCGRELL